MNEVQMLLVEQAERQPDARAMSDGMTTLSFGELMMAVKERSSFLAELHLGSPPLTFLPILVDRSVDSAVNILACLAGRIPYAAVDSTAPSSRLAYLIELLGSPSTVVSGPTVSAGLLESMTRLSPRLSFKDTSWSSFDSDGTEPGMVLTTSGSTGTPKGVVWSHDTVVARIHLSASRVGITDGQPRIPVLSPLHFVAGFTSIVLPLFGCFVRIIDPMGVTPNAFLGTLVDLDPTQMLITPQMARVLSAVVAGRGQLLPSLNKVVTGADTSRYEHFQGLKNVGTAPVLAHIFGSSEAPQSFRFETALANIPDSGQIPLGDISDPLNVHLERLDDTRYEIWRTGPILSGYLRNDELNHRHFHVDSGGVKWWKSGDLVRRNDREEWIFDSRIDDTVKIRGMVASPSEAASFLQNHPGVRAAIVLSRSDRGRTGFVGHIEREPGATVSQEDLIAAMQLRLPDYLIPRELVFHNRLPVNERGKVDRSALKESNHGADVPEEVF